MTQPKIEESIAMLALMTGELPGIIWEHGDDLCDCTFQRIGFWTNPYLGATLHIRLCCVWAELAKQYPQFVREMPAFYDYNNGRFVDGVATWDAAHDMPRAIWYRQLARQSGNVLPEIRAKYADKDPPKAMPKAVADILSVAFRGMRDMTEDDDARSY